MARGAGFDVGQSCGLGIVPIVLGDSLAAMRVAAGLQAAGVNVQPIAFPVVPEGQARLRFFLSASHTEPDLDHTIEALRATAREAA
jgi:7-keto-8-aminopelargonate synthetase-like enzyme